MNLDFLNSRPFNLDAEALAWLGETLGDLSNDEKVAQLFVLLSRVSGPEELAMLARLQPGGVTKLFGQDAEAEFAFKAAYAKASKVPPLVSADIEGSRMSIPFGTPVLNPLGPAAVDAVQATRNISKLIVTEARAASTLPSVQRAMVECLLGRKPWNANSPVDPFCGLEETVC